MSDVIIDIKNMTTRFGTNVIHENFNLSVHRGEVLVLFGGSGAGKSTFLRTLIGLECPAAGECLFEGCNLFSLNEKEWVPYRRKIAYAFQGGALFDSLTVEENLEYPLLLHSSGLNRETRKRLINDTLESLGLGDIGTLYPSSLSGGMQKRVGVARALMLQPEMILYDEPTAGLDPTNSRRMVEIIRTLQAKGKTSIVVTHDVTSALNVGDRFAFISDRKIKALQAKEDMLKSPAPELSAYMKGEVV